MFMLSTIEDHIRVEPAQLGLSTASAVEQEIKRLYFDKVIPNAGLVISLYDILEVQGGDVHVGDGGAHFEAKFRVIIFRPYEGEVLLGRVHTSTETGMTLDLGFTQDVFVPEQYMQTPGSTFDAAAGRWQWQYEDEQMPLDAGAIVRFKVRDVTFPRLDDSALAPPAEGTRASTAQVTFQPMVVTGDIDGDGLGAVDWWDNADVVDDVE